MYMFCKNCEPESVLPVLQIETNTILCSQLLQKSTKNRSSNIGLMEETIDLSHIILFG